MIILKACPRCQGDLHTDRDFYGEYRQCVQCGYMKDLDTESPLSFGKAVPASRKAA